MAYWVNGVGTIHYGRTDPWPDGSYVTTKWIVALFVPLLPLGSYRVWPHHSSGPEGWKDLNIPIDALGPEFEGWFGGLPNAYVRRIPKRPYLTARVPLHIPQVVKGYLVTVAVAALAWVAYKLT